MHTPRLYLPQTLLIQEPVTVSGQSAHHITHVLRLPVGSVVHVFDGQGSEYRAIIKTIDRANVTLTVTEAVLNKAEPVAKITLLQGIARNDHMDLIVQKAVELGVTAIRPLWMQRSQNHLKGTRLEKRTRHWQGIVISACEQSGRATMPDLLPALPFTEQLASAQAEGEYLALDPDSHTGFTEIQPKGKNFYVLVGPEGGLSSEELQWARTKGYTGIHLGPRILRTETAALAAITCIQTLWGDFR